MFHGGQAGTSPAWLWGPSGPRRDPHQQSRTGPGARLLEGKWGERGLIPLIPTPLLLLLCHTLLIFNFFLLSSAAHAGSPERSRHRNVPPEMGDGVAQGPPGPLEPCFPPAQDPQSPASPWPGTPGAPLPPGCRGSQAARGSGAAPPLCTPSDIQPRFPQHQSVSLPGITHTGRIYILKGFLKWIWLDVCFQGFGFGVFSAFASLNVCREEIISRDHTRQSLG